jgi:dTDP-4-dehydrorhamnose reductase
MNLITGGTGQLGTAFRTLWPDAYYPTSRELDLAKPDSVYGLLRRVAPDLIVNCAAYTKVDDAEQEEDLAAAINGFAVGEMARYADDHGIPFVTFSTDYVFSGTSSRPYVESDPTDPINAYGRTKALGEMAALRYEGTLLIRTSWVISDTHSNFVATMLRLIPERQLTVVNDQRGCPTIAADLAAGTTRCLEAQIRGIIHLANPPETTWFDLARRIAQLAGLDPERISPCSTGDYPLPARRPAYSVLGSERLPRLGIAGLPSWELRLPALVAALQAQAD